ncbi:Oxysterolbinding protein, putative [Acanthamoeba castellanii str. Neff]|uniref:Oxysterolbinding protein, putative n=1 Tax=Acanthamoeba castellanii (strain ATCC 30010 / Neff) TaxID=1257118 RepID=L8HG03_ACACF|nr:Oxysterolbinding protein, putative [Acanthamoeba castellanii str. Neff]ELR24070.1 Oxysterolbinding protein, putative [Acanthamoeba castellanii str. Neff]
MNALKCFMKKIATGGVLMHMSLPASLCCPQSTLQALAHHRLRGAPYMHGVWQHNDAFVRMVAVLRWYLAAFSADPDGKKPFNPVLGESYQCYADGVWAILEQVSHHPPVSAYFMLDSERRTCFFGQAEMCLEFSGNAIAVDMIGPARLVLGVKKSLARTQTPAQAQADEHRATGGGSGGGGGGEQQQPQEEVEEERGEGEWWARYEHYDFIPPMPTQVVKSLLWGKRRHSYKGDVVVACSRTGYFAHLHFCEEGPEGEPDFLRGEIYHEPEHMLVAQLYGQWDGIIEITPLASSLLRLGSNASLEPPERPAALTRGDYDAAEAAKEEVERQQREMVHQATVLTPWAGSSYSTYAEATATKKTKKKKKLFRKSSTDKQLVEASWGVDEEEERWRQMNPAVFFDRHRASRTGNVEWLVRWDQVRLAADRRENLL